MLRKQRAPTVSRQKRHVRSIAPYPDLRHASLMRHPRRINQMPLTTQKYLRYRMKIRTADQQGAEEALGAIAGQLAIADRPRS